jgi:peptide/nickel transport system permease protein
LGLDKPFHQHLLDYAKGTLTLDLGTSFRNERPVWQNIVEQLPYTVHLALTSLTFALLIGLPLGVFAALYRNIGFDQTAMVGALAALCIPNFLLGLIFIVIFSGRLGWFPSFGTSTDGGLLELFRHAFLPAVVLGASAAGIQARMTRSALLEVLSRDCIRTARAKGLAERRIVFAHALQNAFAPILTVMGMDLARLLTGTLLVLVVM